MGPVVVGISGASGTILGLKLVKRLVDLKEKVHLVVTPDALLTASIELGKECGHIDGILSSVDRSFVTALKIKDFTADIASGSFQTKGMCIVPCSMSTLAAVALSMGDNLLRRAADVTLKERRPLVIVPREAPFHAVHLEHMLKLTQMGAVIHPPIPAWYMVPKSLDEMEDFLVNRIVDGLKLPQDYTRWSSNDAFSSAGKTSRQLT